MKNLITVLFIGLMFTGCVASKSYNPSRKLSPEALKEDYRIFRETLEESHPSLYWYTPRDSMNYYFDEAARMLSDSMTENGFRYVLSSVLSRIRCGHTTIRGSKESGRYAERIRGILFPISVKAWNDTVVLTSLINRRDSNLVRGVVIKSIEGRPVEKIVDSFFHHLSADGYNTTHKFQTLSNSGVFRTMYGSIYGLRPRIPIEYYDTAGRLRSTIFSMGNISIDTGRMRPPRAEVSAKERKKLAREAMRNLQIDTTLNTAVLEVNTFSKGYGLRKFLRKTFRTLRKDGIENLVVDMRGNGGGSVILSNLLTKYLSDKPFKIADSLYAIRNKSRYKKYQDDYFLNRLFFIFMTRNKNGLYHFSYFENKYFKPKKRNHFSGQSYILTGGNTFSAAALFTKAIREQENVTVVGEETGGGAYGNTAWLIPDVTLPNSRLRFRLPLFRLVVDSKAQKGYGIFPEVEAFPSVDAIRRNADFKLEKAMQLIREKKKI
jgi:hypothetical protein